MPTFSARPLWLACLLLTVPGLRAAAPPWDLQTRPLVERSADGHVNLELDLPVLAGPDRPAVLIWAGGGRRCRSSCRST